MWRGLLKSWKGRRRVSFICLVVRGICIHPSIWGRCKRVIRRWTLTFILDCPVVWLPYCHLGWLGIRIRIVILEGMRILEVTSWPLPIGLKSYWLDGCSYLHLQQCFVHMKVTYRMRHCKYSLTSSWQDHLRSTRRYMQLYQATVQNGRRYHNSKDFHWSGRCSCNLTVSKTHRTSKTNFI